MIFNLIILITMIIWHFKLDIVFAVILDCFVPRNDVKPIVLRHCELWGTSRKQSRTLSWTTIFTRWIRFPRWIKHPANPENLMKIIVQTKKIHFFSQNWILYYFFAYLCGRFSLLWFLQNTETKITFFEHNNLDI